MCACSWRYRHILFFRKNISIRWRNVCFKNGCIFYAQKSIPTEITHFCRFLRRMALRKKFQKSLCASAHGDIATYFFLKKYFDPMEKCVFQWHHYFNVSKTNSTKNDATETHISPSDRNIFSKKKYVAISSWAGAHVGERNLLLMAIWRSYRQKCVISVGILVRTGIIG